MYCHLLQNVEKLELNGSDFLWQVALSSEEQIANVAIEYLLKLSYHALSPRLKKVCIFENSFCHIIFLFPNSKQSYYCKKALIFYS